MIFNHYSVYIRLEYVYQFYKHLLRNHSVIDLHPFLQIYEMRRGEKAGFQSQILQDRGNDYGRRPLAFGARYVDTSSLFMRISHERHHLFHPLEVKGGGVIFILCKLFVIYGLQQEFFCPLIRIERFGFH